MIDEFVVSIKDSLGAVTEKIIFVVSITNMSLNTSKAELRDVELQFRSVLIKLLLLDGIVEPVSLDSTWELKVAVIGDICSGTNNIPLLLPPFLLLNCAHRCIRGKVHFRHHCSLATGSWTCPRSE